MWNVKIERPDGICNFAPVLIETLWNVKVVIDAVQWTGKNRINRNIVECKESNHGKSPENVDFVLIETLWNVKEYTFNEIFPSATVLIETLWNVKVYLLFQTEIRCRLY